MSNLIRQKIIVAIDGQVVRAPEGAPVYVLYLPENELHELALLYMNYLLRASNKKVVYLGQNLPFEDLENTYKQFKASYICTVLTAVPERDQAQAYIDKLSAAFPDATVVLYGYQVQAESLRFPANVKKLGCVKDMVMYFS